MAINQSPVRGFVLCLRTEVGNEIFAFPSSGSLTWHIRATLLHGWAIV